MIYGIALFPDKEVQDAANSWRIRHDPHYCHIPAHMTLREAEEWDDVKLERAVKHLDAVSASFKPFEVTFNRVSTFFPVSNTLYYALEDPSQVDNLHRAICSGPGMQQPYNYVYTPHVTIGRKLQEEELHDLYGNLRMTEIRLSSYIDRIHLLYQTEQGGWTAYQSFQLKG
ncbi:2'-5' RNA ligase family protein [Paenibacillus sp. PL2-23]|uniref:2'-5' RNA ligase family protein n=1 Tax=Paenibacillus sp. PL2-23 TaxID=2100729 RepID=UPI0030FAEC33